MDIPISYRRFHSYLRYCDGGFHSFFLRIQTSVSDPLKENRLCFLSHYVGALKTFNGQVFRPKDGRSERNCIQNLQL